VLTGQAPVSQNAVGALQNVTPEQALAHPNWRMGNRIRLIPPR